ncbi:MAG: Beta-galactosidase C-terminal domain, partial [Pseudomonadota bacterium]
SGINRRINREKLEYSKLCKELEDSKNIRSMVFKGFSKLIRLRRQQRAFSPAACQEVLLLDERVFSLIRHNKNSDERILVLVNVSDSEYEVSYDCKGTDIITGEAVRKGRIHMKPYQVRWIRY